MNHMTLTPPGRPRPLPALFPVRLRRRVALLLAVLAAALGTVTAPAAAPAAPPPAGSRAAPAATAAEDPGGVVQPADATVAPGGTATFTTGAPGALLFTWYRVAEPQDVKVFSSTSNSTYSFVATEQDDGARFYATFLHDGKMLTTRVATLTVGDGTPKITAQPLDVAALDSRPVRFDVAARGLAPLTYAWERSDDEGATWASVAGATGPSLSFDAALTDDGALYRALVDGPVGDPVPSVAARLTVQPLGGELRPVAHASLELGINRIYQGGNPAGNGCNFFSAGKTTGFAGRDGDVRIVHRDGDVRTSVSEGTKCQGATPTDLGQRALFTEGVGTANDVTGQATIAWKGAFTANAYSGLVPWYLEDPTLTVAANGRGTLTAIAGGKGAGRDDPTKPFDVTPREVTVATFAAVEVTPDGITVQPDYAGVDYRKRTDGVRDTASAIGDEVKAGDPQWGSWPESFVDFQYETELSSYWHSSGLSADPDKPPFPFDVRFASAPAVSELPRIDASPATSATMPLVEGREATFTARVGDATSVRWQRGTSATGPWTDLEDGTGPGSVSGAASETLTVRSDASWNGRHLRLRAVNDEGTVDSVPVAVTAKAAQALAFTTQPRDVVTIAGGRVELHARAVGHPAPLDDGYGVELSRDGGASWGALPGAERTSTGGGAGDEFTVPNLPRDADGGLLRVTARNADGDVARSEPVRVRVAAATGGPQLLAVPGTGIDPAKTTTVTIIGVGFEIPEGPEGRASSLDLGLFERGTWQPGEAGTREWLATSRDSQSGQLYRGRLQDSGGWFSVTLDVPADVLRPDGVHGIGAFLRTTKLDGSESTFDDRRADAWTPIVLTGQRAAAIVRSPAAVTAGVGETVELSAAVAGTPAPVVRWQRRGAGQAEWRDLPGESGLTLRRTMSTDDAGAAYRLVAGNGLGPDAVSDEALLSGSWIAGDPVPPGAGPSDAGASGGGQPAGGRLGGTGTTPAATPKPAGRATVTAARRVVRLGRSRVATLATVRCPVGGAACRVAAPRTVTVRIAGRRHRATVLAPTRVAAGRTGRIRLRLSKVAAARLAGRTATVKLRVTVGEPGARRRLTVRARLGARATSAAS
jgi:plastocyanin